MRKTHIIVTLVLAVSLACVAGGGREASGSKGVSPIQDTYVYGPTTFAPGTNAALRVIVAAATGLTESRPVEGVEVRISIAPEEGREISLYKGKTGPTGTLAAEFSLGDLSEGTYTMAVRTSSPYGKGEVKREVRVEGDVKIMLVTDKPIYQPGQTVHIRSLALARTGLRPAAGEAVVIEVEDSKGNKVFKKFMDASEHGIAATRFILADEVNTGAYTVRATVGKVTAEKAITVKRYVLPKFKVEVTGEKDYYLPGETVKGSVRAAYFFGKNVEGGKVVLKASTFDAAFRDFLVLDGTTDEEGVFDFEFPLPDYFAGVPLEKGNALVKIDVEVTDRAEHTEKKTRTWKVSEADLCLELVPEAGVLIPGVENILYAVVSTPGGDAVGGARVAIEAGDLKKKARTNETGMARFAFVPRRDWFGAGGAGEAYSVEVSGKVEDASGRSVAVTKRLGAERLSDTVLLRADKAIYKGGEDIRLTVLSTFDRGTAYIDIVKGGQMAMARAAELDKGRAELSLTPGPDLFGSLEVHAYKILPDGNIVRDTRLLYVSPPDDLNVRIEVDREVYKPGEQAAIRFLVTDKRGRPAGAALGVVVVDESVYALQEIQPGLEKVYFTLEQELAKPRFEIHYPPGGMPMERAILQDRVDRERQEAVKVLLAPARPGSGADWQVHPAAERLAGENTKLLAVHSALYRCAIEQPLGTHRLWHYDRSKGSWCYREDVVGALVDMEYIAEDQSRDPWDRTYRVEDLARVNSNFSLAGLTDRICSERLQAVYAALHRYGRDNRGWLEKMFDQGDRGRSRKAWDLPEDVLERMAAEGYVEKQTFIDPWGYRFVLTRLDEPSDESLFYHKLRNYDLRSVGPDGKKGTADDVTPYTMYQGAKNEPWGFPMEEMRDGARARGVLAGMPPPRPMMKAAMVEEAGDMAIMEMEFKGSPASGARPQVRVREYFPETLLFEPALITDDRGRATLDLALADSITTWRLTAMANSLGGLLGSAATGLRVFQDFFVDIDLPVSLTQGDEVSIPVAVYNYLAEPQSIRLELRGEPWFETLGPSNMEIRMAANEVGVRYFPIKAREIGLKTLTVFAYGSKMEDAIKREVRVAPDGKEFLVPVGGRLGKSIEKSVQIPIEAIDGASKVLVKIYPGVFSQVVEGLDGLLRMPFGCFEQTSSVTYPNVLILDYMKSTGQITPEIQMKAEGFVNLGYQRLLTFEVEGGGFEWFGNDPAHKILTAYGLMEFHDMAQVHEVDRRLIERTAQWLVDQQEPDGSWSPTKRVVDTVARAFTDDIMRNTAYITWALIEADQKGPAADKGILYLREHLKEVKDAYTLALCAMALTAHDPRDAETRRLLEKIHELRIEDDEEKTVFWRPSGPTAVGGRGRSAEIETTALILQALMRAGLFPNTVNKGLNYLVQQKDSHGTWYSTQATIQALRALLAAGSSGPPEVDATVTVSAGGRKVEDIEITPQTSDVLRLVDLGPQTRKGENAIRIESAKECDLNYQIVAKYYLPWEAVRPEPRESPMEITVTYDRTRLSTDDVLKAGVSVSYKGDKTTDMIIVDLGVPPGFKVMAEDFEALVSKGVIEKFTTTGRQVTLYIQQMTPRQTIDFTCRMKAKFPIRAKTPATVVYRYYNPEERAEAEPVVIEVAGRE